MKQSFRVLFSLFKLPVFFWLVIQICFLLFFRSQSLSDPYDLKQSISSETLMLLELFFLILCGYIPLTLGLGYFFNTRSRRSWTIQLPFAEWTYVILPLTILFVYATALRVFVLWDPYTGGLTFFLYILPAFTFLILQRSSEFIVGALKAFVIGSLAIFIWFIFIFDWSARTTTVEGELLMLVIFLAGMAGLVKKNRYVLYAPFLVLIYILGETTYMVQRTPTTLTDAVQSLRYLETSKTIDGFRSMLLNPEVWKRPEQYEPMSYIKSVTHQYVNLSLTSEERIQLIENIEMNHALFADTKLSYRRAGHWSAYLVPYLNSMGTRDFLVTRANSDVTVQRYLLDHWRESKLFCELLISDESPEVLTRLFHSAACRNRLFDSGVLARYSPFQHGPYEQALDGFLLNAGTESPSEIRSILQIIIRNEWHLDKRLLPEKLFVERPLTPDLLKMFRDRYKQNVIQTLRPYANLNQEEFNRRLWTEKSDTTDDPHSDKKGIDLRYMLGYVTGDANSFIYNKLQSKWSFWQHAHFRMRHFNLDINDLFEEWTKRELSKPENWPRLQALFQTVKENM